MKIVILFSRLSVWVHPRRLVHHTWICYSILCFYQYLVLFPLMFFFGNLITHLPASFWAHTSLEWLACKDIFSWIRRCYVGIYYLIYKRATQVHSGARQRVIDGMGFTPELPRTFMPPPGDADARRLIGDAANCSLKLIKGCLWR